MRKRFHVDRVSNGYSINTDDHSGLFIPEAVELDGGAVVDRLVQWLASVEGDRSLIDDHYDGACIQDDDDTPFDTSEDDGPLEAPPHTI